MSEQTIAVKVAYQLDEFYQDVDGYIYYWPADSPHGCMAAHHLREIADELDRKNADWDAHVKAYLNQNERSTNH